MIQLNRGLSVWQKLTNFFHQILSFLWKEYNRGLRGHPINKNRYQPEPYWSKTNQNIYLKPGNVLNNVTFCDLIYIADCSNTFTLQLKYAHLNEYVSLSMF